MFNLSLGFAAWLVQECLISLCLGVLFPFDIAKLRRKSAHSKFFPFFRSSLLRHTYEFATNRGSTPKICRKMDGFDGFDTFISNFLTRTVRARYAWGFREIIRQMCQMRHICHSSLSWPQRYKINWYVSPKVPTQDKPKFQEPDNKAVFDILLRGAFPKIVTEYFTIVTE